MSARSTSASVLSAHGIAAVIGGKPERYQSGGTSATLPINQKVYSILDPQGLTVGVIDHESDGRDQGGDLRNQWAVLIAGVLVVGLLIAGCGGGGDGTSSGTSGSATEAGSTGTETGSTGTDSSSTESGQGATETGTISKAAFSKGAEGICRETVNTIVSEASAVIEKRQNSPDFNRAATEASLVSTVVVPGLQAEVDQLRALGAPSGDESQVKGILDAIQEVIEEAKADPKAAQQNNNLYATADKLAEAYGLKECPYGYG